MLLFNSPCNIRKFQYNKWNILKSLLSSNINNQLNSSNINNQLNSSNINSQLNSSNINSQLNSNIINNLLNSSNINNQSNNSINNQFHHHHLNKLCYLLRHQCLLPNKCHPNKCRHLNKCPLNLCHLLKWHLLHQECPLNNNINNLQCNSNPCNLLLLCNNNNLLCNKIGMPNHQLKVGKTSKTINDYINSSYQRIIRHN